MSDAQSLPQSPYDLMLSGAWYDAGDDDLEAMRAEGNLIAHEYSLTRPDEAERRRELLERLLGHAGEGIEVLPPVYVDYGSRVSVGDGTFVNHGAYLMDGGGITIGKRCQIGPWLGAYTAAHPLVAAERATGLEKASPIVIEDDVWVGANVVVMPGVTIGKGSVIGAGSVVTKDIPAGVVAYGNPCRVAREIDDGDRVCGPDGSPAPGAAD